MSSIVLDVNNVSVGKVFEGNLLMRHYVADDASTAINRFAGELSNNGWLEDFYFSSDRLERLEGAPDDERI